MKIYFTTEIIEDGQMTEEDKSEYLSRIEEARGGEIVSMYYVPGWAMPSGTPDRFRIDGRYEILIRWRE